MRRTFWWFLCLLVLGAARAWPGGRRRRRRRPAPQAWTWEQVKERLELNNPTLLADKLNIDESKAEEITALPAAESELSLTADRTRSLLSRGCGPAVCRYLAASGISLSARAAAQARVATGEREKRNRDRGVRSMPIWSEACCSTCAARSCRRCRPKRCCSWRKDNLEYYDHVLQISRDRYQAGDIAQIDLDRLELQRVQYESDVQTATVNLRTAKIQMLTLLNDRTPMEQFDRGGRVRFQRSDLTRWMSSGKIALDNAAGFEGGACSGGQSADRSQAGGGERIDGSDVQRVMYAQRESTIRLPLILWRGRELSAAHFRSQSGRETAHAAGYHAQRKAARRGAGAGVQRRGFGVCDAGQQSDSAAALQGEVSGSRRCGCGTRFYFLTSTAGRRCWIF